MADVGMVNASGNKMTMAIGRFDVVEANRIFQSANLYDHRMRFSCDSRDAAGALGSFAVVRLARRACRLGGAFL